MFGVDIQCYTIVIVKNTTGINCLKIDNGDEKEEEEVEEKAEEDDEITKGNKTNFEMSHCVAIRLHSGASIGMAEFRSWRR